MLVTTDGAAVGFEISRQKMLNSEDEGQIAAFYCRCLKKVKKKEMQFLEKSASSNCNLTKLQILLNQIV